MQTPPPHAVLAVLAALVGASAVAGAVADPVTATPAWAATEGTADAAPAPADPPAAPPRFRLVDALASAEVTVADRRSTRRCVWQASAHRFACGPRDWQFVGPWAGRSNGEAVRCVWVHPPRGGKTLELRWADVALGAHLRATLHLMDGAGHRDAVRATVRVDDRQVAQVETPSPRQPARASATLPPGPPRGALSIQVKARDSAWRLACIDVQLTGTRRPR
jgi:hypothetical protein